MLAIRQFAAYNHPRSAPNRESLQTTRLLKVCLRAHLLCFRNLRGFFMRPKRFAEAFDRLAAAEEQFLQCEFLAPVLPGVEVRVRMAGVVCRMQISPRDFQGWGIFRPTSYSAAALARTADLAQRKRFLELFPVVRLILCRREKSQWLAAPAHRGDRRFRIDGLVPVRFVDEAEQFEIVRARFDGGQFWFEEIEPAGNAATAAWLRQSLRQRVAPNLLDRSGLTPEERAAYAANYWMDAEAIKRRAAEATERRLRDALDHAGAELIDYLERGDSYRVTFLAGNQRIVSAVRKNDLTVQVAGICLSGRDQHFDLASLVGVIREAEGTGEIVPVGRENRGIQEQRYWDVHPRE
jgi:hypothetical protein